MKSLKWLHDCVLAEAQTRCGTDTHRDRLTLSRRTKHEGDSFLTITLPRFGRDFESCLEQGEVGSDAFLGFKRTSALPRFLSGLLSLVFDPVGGKLLEHPCIDSIIAIRQFCLMSKKVLIECSPKRVSQSFDTYVQVDNDLRDHFTYVSDSQFRLFGRISDVVVSQILGDLNCKVEAQELVPRHGPGATAEKIFGNQKYLIGKWHHRLEPFFPLSGYGVPTPYSLIDGDDYEAIEIVEPDAEQPVRVVSVPKTLDKPRIIAIEPVCMQYTQQAIAAELVNALERNSLSSGCVNFHDQSINRNLAQDQSRSRRYATVDLSEASDRVHQDLVFRMLNSVPTLRDAIFACRSTRASLEDGRTIQLAKFASMGSALCFPVEAMVFWIICIYGILQSANLPPTMRNIRKIARTVYVYGDDIILPADKVPAVSLALSSFGLKVNSNKTFVTGKFRESCGMDAYDGIDVTPVYVRREAPRSRHCPAEIVSFVSLANQLYTRGWWATARTVRARVESVTGPLPHVLETSPSVGWYSFLGTYTAHRWNKELHSWKTKGLTLRSRMQDDQIDGYPALMKYFLTAGSDTLSVDEKHLERSVRPGSASIKFQWVSPY